MFLTLARAMRFPKLSSSGLSFRTLNTAVRPPRTRLSGPNFTKVGLASSTIAGASLYLYIHANTMTTAVHADAEVGKRQHDNGSAARLSELLRTYVVYTLCSVPLLVDWSPAILSTLMSIPGVNYITEGIVRVTFFNQFVGGDSAEDVVPVLERLRSENKGAIFVYSVEVDETQASGYMSSSRTLSPHKQIVQENIHCIDVAANFEDECAYGSSSKGTWVAVKLSALVPDADSLRRLSKYLVRSRPRSEPRVAFPGFPLPSDLDILASGPNGIVTAADIAALRELREDLVAICERAQARGVRITIDAEHSFYQPAIDAFTLDMMRTFNKLPSQNRSWFKFGQKSQPQTNTFQPLVYNTVQGYLRRTPEYLTQSIAAARAEGYALGIKLVRGAYHPQEIELHREVIAVSSSPVESAPSHGLSISPDNMPPVWLHKDETDACYDASVRKLIQLIREDVEHGQSSGPAIGVLFGTHNWESVNLVVDELVGQGLATAMTGGDRVWTRVNVGEETMRRVAVAQLYGMSDALTDHLVERVRSASPFVLKYLPYGKLSEVMPYLGRRAIENKSVLGDGAAALERKRAASAIKSMLFS